MWRSMLTYPEPEIETENLLKQYFKRTLLALCLVRQRTDVLPLQ